MEKQDAPRDWFSKPGDSLRGLMARRQVTPQDLAEKIQGGSETVRGLFAGTVAIDSRLADALSQAVGGSRDFWINRQAQYEVALERAVTRADSIEGEWWLRNAPLPGSTLPGRLSEAKRRDEIQRRLVFYSVPTSQAWSARYGRFQSSARFRTSETFDAKPGANILWLRQGELECDLAATRPWSAVSLRDRLQVIRGLSRISQPARFLPKLKAIFAEAGVALIVVRAPTGCRASGASALVAPDKAMLLVSFRYRADDQFWFTIFHEIGHLLLHQGRTFVDEDGTPEDVSEQEANEFARSCIIPPSRMEEFNELSPRARAVTRFSVSIGIAPGLTVGQMQRRGVIKYSNLNSLKRYWSWADIAPAMS